MSSKRPNPTSSPKSKSKKPSLSQPNEAAAAPEPDGGGSDAPASKLFQKFWTDGDEVAVLKAIISFRSERGRTPVYSDMPDFLVSIRPSLQNPRITKDQVYNKIRRVKSNYLHGPSSIPSSSSSSASPHDHLLHELSTEIWGGAQGKKKKKKKTSVEEHLIVEEEASSDGEKSDELQEVGMKAVYPFFSDGMAEYLKVNKDLEGCWEWINPAKGRTLEKKFEQAWRSKMKVKGQRFDIYKELGLHSGRGNRSRS